MSEVVKVAVLLTCHNRMSKTLECLNSLYSSTIPDGLEFNTVLVDDGSMDGTGDAIQRMFPKVNLLKGNGELFWAGGMRKAWEEAARIGYDYYLWLNDDTVFYPDALKVLIQTSQTYGDHAIVCGSACHPLDRSKQTYGGYDEKWNIIQPSDNPQNCIFFNGNIVLIPKFVFDVLGNLDKAYTHALADFDYGIRAQQNGIRLLVAPGFLGECENHEKAPRWCREEGTPWQRLRYLYQPLGNPPFEFFVFDQRQNGTLAALKHFLTLHLRSIFPQFWRLQK